MILRKRLTLVSSVVALAIVAIAVSFVYHGRGKKQTSVQWPADGLYVADWYGYTGVSEEEKGAAVDVPCVLVHTAKGSSTTLSASYFSLTSPTKSLAGLSSVRWIRGEAKDAYTFYTLHIELSPLTAGSYNATSIQLQTPTGLKEYPLSWIVDVKKITNPMIAVTGQSMLGGPHTGQLTAELKNTSQESVTIKGLSFRLMDHPCTISTGALKVDPFATKNSNDANGLGSMVPDGTPQPEAQPLTNPEAYTILPGQKKAFVFETTLSNGQSLPPFESIKPFVHYSNGISDGFVEFTGPQVFSEFPQTDQDVVKLLNTQFHAGTSVENR